MLKLELFNQEMNCLKSSSFKSRARKSIRSGVEITKEQAQSKVNKKNPFQISGEVWEKEGDLLCL